jgi:TonB family protein
MLSILDVSHAVPRIPRHTLNGALAGSMALHAAALAMFGSIAIGVSPAPAPVDREPPARRSPPTPIVFVATGPATTASGGGGGGGNRQPGPIRRAQSHGTDAATLRIAKPIATVGTAEDAPALPGLLLDAKPLASGDREQVGLPSGGASFGTSTGPGSGGGVGTGTGTGIGPGRGPGLGDGVGGGMGGGVYRPGGSVTAPRLLQDVRPKYTPSALERRIQGTVVLELIVTTEGTPTAIRVVRSLDPDGLDKEAIDAVRQWKFSPGKNGREPVAVLVTVLLDFTIR